MEEFQDKHWLLLLFLFMMCSRLEGVHQSLNNYFRIICESLCYFAQVMSTVPWVASTAVFASFQVSWQVYD